MTRYLTFTKSSLLELFVFAFITSALVLVTVMMSKYIAINVPSPIEAKAIRHKSSHYFSSGIICSLNCYNVLIENNQIYNNGGAGIMFSRNMSNSIARNNIIFNEVKGIVVSQSHYNKIYNNTISDSQYGINVVFGSSGNTFYSNVIKNSSHGIDLDSTSNNSQNTFYNNQLERQELAPPAGSSTHTLTTMN
jgi:parallel beta-helix repeat protein